MSPCSLCGSSARGCLLALLPWLASPVQSQLEPKALAFVESHASEIAGSAGREGIPAQLLAAVVYAERALNMTPGEGPLEEVLAHAGYNASLGPAQVKLETARWLLTLDQCGWLKKLVSNEEHLVDSLISPRPNLAFAACYLSVILKTWRMNPAHLPPQDVAIAASIYSLGSCGATARFDYSTPPPHQTRSASRPGVSMSLRRSKRFSRDLLESAIDFTPAPEYSMSERDRSEAVVPSEGANAE